MYEFITYFVEKQQILCENVSEALFPIFAWRGIPVFFNLTTTFGIGPTDCLPQPLLGHGSSGNSLIVWGNCNSPQNVHCKCFQSPIKDSNCYSSLGFLFQFIRVHRRASPAQLTTPRCSEASVDTSKPPISGVNESHSLQHRHFM